MAAPLTLTEGQVGQAGAGALKAAPQEAAAQPHPVKAIAAAAAALVRVQVVEVERGQRAAAVVWSAAQAAQVVHLPLPAQRLHARAEEAVALTAQVVRVVAVWAAITPTMAVQAQRAQLTPAVGVAAAAQRVMVQTVAQALSPCATSAHNA